MANVIKLKRGTSTPTTSDIANGEVAIDTSAQKFYVNDGGTVKEIGGGASTGVSDGSITTAKLADDAVTDAKLANSINSAIAANTAKVTNANHTGDVTGSTALTIANNAVTTNKIADDAVTSAKLGPQSVDSNAMAENAVIRASIADNAVSTAKIADDAVTNAKILQGTVITESLANDAVTYAKIQNVSATNRILGRDSEGSGSIEEITPANLRTMINVENGATADQTAAEIKTAYESNSNTNAFTDAEQTKLSNIEPSATADQTSSDIRGLGFFDTSNDGSGSGLDADLLDGQHGSHYLNYNNLSNTPSIPTNTSDLTNDSNFITSATNNFVSSASFSGGTLTLNRQGLSALTISGIGTSTFDGAYSSLSGLPTIPTTTNQLTNNSNFITSSSNITGTSGGFTAGNASNLNSGTISDARLPSSISSDITGNAATATKLATARTIAGTSFDGSANINISYNSLTNLPSLFSGNYNDLSNKPTIPTDTNSFVTGASMSGTTLTLTRNDSLSSITVTIPTSAPGNRWGVVTEVQGDGVMEVGQYLDFHTSDGDTSDFGGGRITGGSSFSFSNACFAPSFTGTSDRNIKNSIQDSDLGLDFINLLKPVSFKWNQDVEELTLDTKTHHGLIAQDVEDVITGLGKTLDDICIAVKPEGKTKNGKDLPMAVDYNQLVTVLIKAVQELSAKVETLETKVS